jgi:hypothetical protein
LAALDQIKKQTRWDNRYADTIALGADEEQEAGHRLARKILQLARVHRIVVHVESAPSPIEALGLKKRGAAREAFAGIARLEQQAHVCGEPFRTYAKPALLGLADNSVLELQAEALVPIGLYCERGQAITDRRESPAQALE